MPLFEHGHRRPRPFSTQFQQVRICVRQNFDVSQLQPGTADIEGFLGCGLSLVAGFFLLIGLIPFLGWVNWITTVPLSALAAILCYTAINGRREPSPIARIGLLAASFILLLALFRLTLGGGLI